MSIKFSSIQLIVINVTQSSTVALNNEIHTNLTGVSDIPSAQVFIPKDTIFRLKSHSYRRFSDVVSNITINGTDAQGFLLTDMKLNTTLAEPDLLMELNATTQIVYITLNNINLKGTGHANFTEAQVLGEWFNIDFEFDASASSLTFEVTADQQEKDEVMIPALKFQNAVGHCNKMDYKITGDSDWVKILNGCPATYKQAFFDSVVRPISNIILRDQGISNEIAKTINKNILYAGWPTEQQLPEFDAKMRLNQKGVIKVVDNGMILDQNMRFHPAAYYKEYEVCEHPKDLYQSTDHFYDMSLVVGTCFVNSLIQTLIENGHKQKVPPVNLPGFGQMKMEIVLKKAENAYVRYINGKIETKLRATCDVDYDPPFTMSADANVSWTLYKEADGGKEYGENRIMANYKFMPRIENIYNIDTSESMYVPAALVDAVFSLLQDKMFAKLNPLDGTIHPICVNKKAYDEFCLQNPQINVFRNYILAVGDMSYL